MSRLVVPLVLWNAPPAHVITALVLTNDGKTLITGSQSGGICLWTVGGHNEAEVGAFVSVSFFFCLLKNNQQGKERLKPSTLLVGESTIVALALATIPPVEAVVSRTCPLVALFCEGYRPFLSAQCQKMVPCARGIMLMALVWRGTSSSFLVRVDDPTS